MKNIADEGLPQTTEELILLLEEIYQDKFPDLVEQDMNALLVHQGKMELIRWLREQQDRS